MRTRRASRATAAGVGLTLLLFGVTAGAQTTIPEPIIELRAAAGAAEGQLHVNPNFELLPAYAFAQATNDSSHALHGALYPGFLVDAFFYLYGAQSVERTVLGIAESLWPQGPEERDATISSPLLRNLGSPDSFPAKLGRASSFSKRLRTGGQTLLAGLTLPNATVGEIGSATSLDGNGSAGSGSGRLAKAAASQTASDVNLGGGAVRIEKVHGTAQVVSASSAQQSSASAELVVAGAVVGGTPVRITRSGVEAATTQSTAAANQVLSALGIELRLLPGGRSVEASGTRVVSTASSGGLLIAFDRAFRPPDSVRSYNDQFCAVLGGVQGASGTCVHPDRDTRIALILGAADVRSVQGSVRSLVGGGSIGGASAAVRTVTETVAVPSARVLGAQVAAPAIEGAEPQLDALPASRRVTSIFGFPATLADAVKAAYLALIVVAAIVVAGRRILRSASAP